MVTGAQDTAETIVARLVETDEVDDVLGRFEPAWWYIAGIVKDQHLQGAAGADMPKTVYYGGGDHFTPKKEEAFLWFDKAQAERNLAELRTTSHWKPWFVELKLEPEYSKSAYDEIKFDQRTESVDDDIEAEVAKVQPLAYVVACDSAEVEGVTYYLYYPNNAPKFTIYIQDARMFKRQEAAREAMEYALKANGYPWKKTQKPKWMGRVYVTSYFGESLDDVADTLDRFEPSGWVIVCTDRIRKIPYYYIGQGNWHPDASLRLRMEFPTAESARETLDGFKKTYIGVDSWADDLRIEPFYLKIGESLDDVADTLERFKPDGWHLVTTDRVRGKNYYYQGLGRWTLCGPDDSDVVLYPSAEDAAKALAHVNANYTAASWADDTGIRVEPYYRKHTTEALLEAHYKNSTTQINIPENIAGHMLEWGKLNIPEEDLYFDEKGGCGREKEPHITVKYGVPMPTPSEELRAIVHSFRPFKITLGAISLFKNSEFDVVKVDVYSPELHDLNARISKAFPVESKYPSYVPHATIAYTKPGTCHHLEGVDIFEGWAGEHEDR